MADSCTFSFYIELRDNLSPLELHTLDYLFNERRDPPATWPRHAFFELGAPPYPMGGPNVFPGGAYVSASWRASDHPGMFSGVHFTCPNLKSYWFYEYHLYLAKWLATLSCARGYVGSFKDQGDEKGLPWLFFVYDRQLYMAEMNATVPLVSLETGCVCKWP